MKNFIYLLLALFILISPQVQSADVVTYFHHNHHGSIVQVADNSGVFVKTIDYKVEGSTSQADSQNEYAEYAGHTIDPDTGLIYMKARWYDPRLQRFLSIDPVSATIASPLSFNRYTYANNNPVKFVDPDGEWVETALDLASLAVSAAMFIDEPTFLNGMGLTYDAIATVIPILPAGVGMIRTGGNVAEIAWSSKGVRDAAKALEHGATEVRVGSRSDAEELFLGRYQGQGYSNSTGMSPTEAKDFYGAKSGTYHWDVGDKNYPHGTDHLQIHTYEGDVIRIYFE